MLVRQKLNKVIELLGKCYKVRSWGAVMGEMGELF